MVGKKDGEEDGSADGIDVVGAVVGDAVVGVGVGTSDDTTVGTGVDMSERSTLLAACPWFPSEDNEEEEKTCPKTEEMTMMNKIGMRIASTPNHP